MTKIAERIASRLGLARTIDAFILYSELFSGTFSNWRLSDAADPIGTFTALAALFGAPTDVVRSDIENPITLRGLRATNIDSAIVAVGDANALELTQTKDKGLTVAHWFAQLMNHLAPDLPRTIDDVSASEQMVLFGLFLSYCRTLSRALGRDVLAGIP